MDEARLVLFDKLRGRKVFGEAPDEIHLHVNRAQGQPRLEDEQDAAIEQAACADERDDHRNPAIARARDGDNPDGDARGDEDAERQIKDRHRALQETSAAGQLVQLNEDHGAAVVQEFQVSLAVRQFLQFVRERAHSVNDAPQPC